MSDTTTCRVCGAEFNYDPPPAVDWPGVPLRPTVCDGCAQRAADQEAAEITQSERAARNIPPRYECATFESFVCGSESQARALEAVRQCRDGVYLMGRSGCGKTHLACAAVAAGPERSLFLPTTELLDDIRAGFDAGGRGLLRRALSAPVLAIDDLGAEAVTDWVRDRLYTLLNERWNHCLPLIVTTNCTPRAIAERIGDGAASRIAGLCARRIEVKGADMRRAS